MDDVGAKLKDAAELLQKHASECGLDKVQSLVQKFGILDNDELSKQTEKINRYAEQVEELRAALENAIADPSKLSTPAGGCMGGCMAGAAQSYGTEVGKRLTQLKDEVIKLRDEIRAIPNNMMVVTSKSGEVKKAFERVGVDVDEMVELPKYLAGFASELKEPGDVTKINEDKLKKAADVEALNGSTAVLQGGIDTLKPACKDVKKAVSNLTTLIQTGPQRIEQAFSVSVGCVPTSCFMPETPPACTSLKAKVKELSGCEEITAMAKTLENAVTRLEGVNMDSVSGPVKKYADFQKEQVDNILGFIEPIKEAQQAGDALSKGLKNIGGMLGWGS